MNKATPTFSLKDQLFNKEKVEYISGLIQKSYPDFSQGDFIEEVVLKFPDLELKQRITHISNMFQKYLPDNFEDSVNILLKSLPKKEENGTLDNNFGDFIFCPYSFFVAEYGCNKKSLDFSLDALEKITSSFSCEDAIRYFFNAFEGETFEKMLEWSTSKNYHVRRLSSEGSRKKLPWCQNINLDYKKTIQILGSLYTDESRYVTRSVANHLNDISKIDPRFVVKTLVRWKESGKSKDIDYIISHSTRTLVKLGDSETLRLLGYSPNPKIEVKNLKIKNQSIKIGESLEFSFTIIGKIKENLIIDYKIHFVGKNGKLLPKVFKIKRPKFEKDIKISKKHPLRMMTTKALYEGEHFVEIMINGKSFGKHGFELKF